MAYTDAVMIGVFGAGDTSKLYIGYRSQNTWMIEHITQLPDGNKAKLISIGGTEIDVGRTGGKIPSWSFGIFLPSSGSSDACLFCFNATQITAAYKSNDIWVSCKKINME